MAAIGFVMGVAGLPGGTLPVLPVSATPDVGTENLTFTVGGTTAITGIDTTIPIRPGRMMIWMGTDATGPAITDTAIASTANGKIHLSAALTLANGSVLTLVQANNGSWWEAARSANG